MGVPESADEFVRLEIKGVTIYVARQLLEELEVGARQMPFYIDGYGRFQLAFTEPWIGLDGR